jgi:hypothetical protein
MDYIKLYYTLCTYCKETPLHERISKRNSNDDRLQKNYIYTEKHHIIPKHSGGTDDLVNIVELLPEEHFMAHYIRYMAYNDKNDYISIRFMVNGYKNKKFLINEIPKTKLNKMVKTFKQGIGEFRKKHSWHTVDGVRRISESRSGNMPVMTDDNKIISVPTTHPKVLSGEWVHHTKGKISVFDEFGNKLRITSNEYRNNKHKYVANTGTSVGSDNPKYSGYTDDDIVNFISELSLYVGCGYVIPYNICREYYSSKFGYTLPKFFSKFRFNGIGKRKLYELVCKMTKLPYNPYIMNNPKYGNVIRNKINELLKK